MTFFTNNGKWLAGPNGGLAGSASCCCDQVCPCCRNLPSVLHATVEWCGTNSFELNEVSRDCLRGPPCLRIWRGSGRWGGVGNNDGIVEFACESSAGGDSLTWYARHDACLGFGIYDQACPTEGAIAGWATFFRSTNPCPTLFLEQTNAPPSSCGTSCTDPFTLTITE